MSNPFEELSIFVFNLKFFEKSRISIAKCLFFVMRFLIHNISNYRIQKPLSKWKSTIPILPFKFLMGEFPFLYEIIGRFFHFSYPIRKTTIAFNSDQNMNMVGHSIDCQQFLIFVLNDTCGVFVQLIFPIWKDKTFSSFYSKNKMNM